MPPNKPLALEICVETVQGIAACRGLADRIELCSGLAIGGLTPSLGMMRSAAASGLETHVLIRPRTGDFSMSEQERDLCCDDIETVKTLGLAGVVIGTTRDDQLDLPALTQMAHVASGLSITLHRAFDVVCDMDKALEDVISLGFDRVLTSGGCENAAAGHAMIQRLGQRAAGRIEIMAGGGITPANVAQLLDTGAIDAIHASCTDKIPLPSEFAEKGFGGTNTWTNRDKIEALRRACSLGSR